MMDNQSDLGVDVVDPATGEVRTAFPVVVEEIAVGTVAAVRRARRADPLDAIADCTKAMRRAAAVYRQAYEHVGAGMGMGPLPWGRDVTPIRSAGPALFCQERALSAALWLRRGMEAMGQEATGGVVHWVVITGGTLAGYDADRRWRRHTARARLLDALDRLAGAYKLGDGA